ncbi:hypothetical protein [Solidesulfovibrio alcoholivorans]|uniref:hypothetical protein n=1 Tax=Solidesulfovibrio alcoholivorans TaxID=81406 RepID=UPI000693BA81|nr:hypothetical protein [Solidesulfovibrio alcoholivorans]
MIPATLITATVPARLSKCFHLGDDGTLVKAPGGQLVDGLAETMRFPTLAVFADALGSLTPTNAMVYGICGHDRARVLAQDQLTKATAEGLPMVARTRDHFRYPAGPAIMMIDHDTIKGGAPLSNEALLSALYGVCPLLERVAHILAQSASSFIYEGHRELIGQRGRRIYVTVADGRDIPRAGAVLFKRLQLAGLGHIEIGKAGQLLERGLADAAVYQPERLDFCGGAACEAPLVQRRPLPVLYNAEAHPLDTRAALPDLTPAEEARRREIVAALKDAVRPEAAKRREAWADEQVGRILARIGKTSVSHPQDADKLRAVYRNATDHRDLYGEFELVMADGKTVTVADVLADPDRFHGKRCADPLEPSYGNDKRIAVLNLRAAGKPYVFSHAHGGIRYSLRRERRAHVVRAGERLAAVEAALGAMRGDGTLYERNGEIVRVTDQGTIVPLAQAGILLELDRLVRWQKFTKTGDITPCDCPRPVAEGVVAMVGKWGLPKLTAVTTAPLYLPRDDRVVDRDGYDAGSGILVVCPDLDRWPGVPMCPTMEHVKDALERLWQPFREFPFTGALDRGVFLAAILTAMGRPAYATAPGFLIVASTAGSGKTLLAKCLSVIAGEEVPSVMTGAEDDAEMRKRLIAVGRRGAAVIVLDNLTGYLDSDALCAWLTSECLADRILGVSEDVMVRTGGVLIATGNNVTPKGDLCRRVVTCRIEAETETPWKRSFDLDPVQYCRDHRLELVAAGLTVLRYYMRQPNPLKDRTASFEEWSDTIRRAVAGVARDGLMDVADPVESIDAAYADDPETGKLRALLTVWNGRYGRTPMTIAEVRADTDTDENLKSVLEEIAWDGRDINPRRLGRWVERNAGRIVDGMRFERGGKRHGVLIWQVRGGFQGVLRVSVPPTREESEKKNTDGPEITPETLFNPPSAEATFPREVRL